MAEKAPIPELKNCPFCGGQPMIGWADEGRHWFVKCLGCGAKTPALHLERELAAKHWNTRVDPDRQALVEALTALDAIIDFDRPLRVDSLERSPACYLPIMNRGKFNEAIAMARAALKRGA